MWNKILLMVDWVVRCRIWRIYNKWLRITYNKNETNLWVTFADKFRYLSVLFSFYFSFRFFSFLFRNCVLNWTLFYAIRLRKRTIACEILTHHRITTNQKHITFVANAYRFRWVRQDCSIVAAGVTENVPAIATMVL